MKVAVVQCDGPECKKSATLHSDTLDGWFKAMVTNRLQHLHVTDNPEEGDFCSPECLLQWLDTFALRSVNAK